MKYITEHHGKEDVYFHAIKVSSTIILETYTEIGTSTRHLHALSLVCERLRDLERGSAVHCLTSRLRRRLRLFKREIQTFLRFLLQKWSIYIKNHTKIIVQRTNINTCVILLFRFLFLSWWQRRNSLTCLPSPHVTGAVSEHASSVESQAYFRICLAKPSLKNNPIVLN